MTPIVKMSKKETQFLSESSDEEKDLGFSSSSSLLSPNNSKPIISSNITPDVKTEEPNAKRRKTSSRRKAKSSRSKTKSSNDSYNNNSFLDDSSLIAENITTSTPAIEQDSSVSSKKNSRYHIPKELNSLNSPYDFWYSSHSRVTRRSYAKSKNTDSGTPVNSNKRRQSQRRIKQEDKKFRTEQDKSISLPKTEEHNSFIQQNGHEGLTNFNSSHVNELESNAEEKSEKEISSDNIMKDRTNIDYKGSSEDSQDPKVGSETSDENNVVRTVETCNNRPNKENVFDACIDPDILNTDQISPESLLIDADGDYLLDSPTETANSDKTLTEHFQSEVLNSSNGISVKLEHDKKANSCEIITYEISSDEDSRDNRLTNEAGNISIENLTPQECVVNNSGDLDINFYISAYKKHNDQKESLHNNDSQYAEGRQMKIEPKEEVAFNNYDDVDDEIPNALEENNYSTNISADNYLNECNERQCIEGIEHSQNYLDRIPETDVVIVEENYEVIDEENDIAIEEESNVFIDEDNNVVIEEENDVVIDEENVVVIEEENDVVIDETEPPMYSEYQDSNDPTAVIEGDEAIVIHNGTAQDNSENSLPTSFYFQGFTESQVYVSFMKKYLCEAAKGRGTSLHPLSPLNYRGDKYKVKMILTKCTDGENTSLPNRSSVLNNDSSSFDRNVSGDISVYPSIPDVYLVEGSTDRHDDNASAEPSGRIVTVNDGPAASPAKNLSGEIPSIKSENCDMFSPSCSYSPDKNPSNESQANSQIYSQAEESDPLFIEPGSLTQDIPQNDFWSTYALSPPSSPSIVTRMLPLSDDEASQDMIEGTPQKGNLTFTSLNASNTVGIVSPPPAPEIIDFTSLLCEEALPASLPEAYADITIAEKTVIAVTGLPLSERQTVQVFAEMFGFEFTNSLRQKYSILIMSPKKPEEQTFKYILAIASRALIVSMSWINESLRAKRPLPPEEFILINEGGPLRCLRDDIPFPLDGISVCIELLEDGYPGGPALQFLCELAGAKVIKHVEHIDSPSRNGDYPFPRLFLFKDEFQLTSQVLNKCSSHLAVAVSFRWLYDCLFAYKILPIVPYLSSTFVSTPDLLTETYQIPEELVPSDD